LLGRHVLHRARPHSFELFALGNGRILTGLARNIFIPCAASRPKIDQTDTRTTLEDDVLGLQIAMDYPVAVDGRERFQNSECHALLGLEIETAALLDHSLCERATFDVLHREEPTMIDEALLVHGRHTGWSDGL
jgi:hypothetical protein